MEIFGLVMVEGAAAGLPIIASVFAGGTADVVEHGVNGLVIDPNDLPAYAGAMATLVDDPELRRRMGEVARKKAETELVPERSADGYLTALRKTWKNRQIR